MKKDALSSKVKEITVHSEQSPKKIDCSIFGGLPTNEKSMANPENDSP